MSQSMSSESSTGPENEYLVVIQDYPGTQAQRTQAQPKHIEEATPLIDGGKITYFGVTLTKHIKREESHVSNIMGSAIVMKAESEQAVRDFLERDAYTKAGVWNVKQAQIWPFRSG